MKPVKFLKTGSLLLIFCLMAGVSMAANTQGDNLVKEERALSGFKKISVRNAINLVVKQGSAEKVTVEASEDVIHHLYTEVAAGELSIGIKGSVHNTGEMNVYVTVKELNRIESSSAAVVQVEGKIETGEMKIASSSASSVKMEVSCEKLEISTSSASKVQVTGTAKSLITDSSSASSINSTELKAEKGELEASSGASVKVQVTKEVDARASSGAGITITGNPASRNSEGSSGGSVRFK
jgi:hypothetical protein